MNTRENDSLLLLKNRLTSFSKLNHVPITLFDQQHTITWEENSPLKICTAFKNYTAEGSPCSNTLKGSGNMASQLGEPYTYVCPAGFINISLSLYEKGHVVGTLVLGPLTMGEIKESTLRNMMKINDLSYTDIPSIVIQLKKMTIFEPKEVAYLADLFHCCLLASTKDDSDYQKKNKTYQEQVQIGKQIQAHKSSNTDMGYPYELENGLIEAIHQGNVAKSQNLLSLLLSKISILESGDLTLIKTKVIGLCAIISRRLTAFDSTPHAEFEINETHMMHIHTAESFQELSTLLSHIVQEITHRVRTTTYSGKSHLISETVNYLNAHYNEKIALSKVAKMLYANPSYLSVLFKQEMGITFSDYLNTLKIDKSKELLLHTNKNLAEVGALVGYEDQSYFTKVFKTKEGMTPKDFRKRNQ